MNNYLKHIIQVVQELLNPVLKALRELSLALIVLFITGYTSNAQDIQIHSSLDTNTILIGEQAVLSVDLQYPKGVEVLFPILKDTIVGEIEVLNLSLDTIRDANLEHYIINYTITSFDSGYYVIPPQLIINQNTGDTIQSNPLAMAVNTYQIDSASQGQFFDIKVPIEAPWTLTEFLEEYYPFMLMGLLLIALLLAIFWYIKKRKQIEKPVVKKIIPKEAAHIVALRELTLLKEKKLWQSDRIKLYYVELSDIVRTYLENRFQISALEQTSHEILDAIRNEQQLDKDEQLQLKQILSTADMVKFAKAKPLANENDLVLKNAFELVEHTKIVEQKVSDNSENKPNIVEHKEKKEEEDA